MRFLLVLLLFSGVISCNSDKDARFCECLKISEQLNQTSEKFSQNSLKEIKQDELESFKNIRLQKDSICKPYEFLGGEELLKKKETCE